MAHARIQARSPRVTTSIAANDNRKPRGCRWSQVIAAFRVTHEPLAVLVWKYRAEGKTPDNFIDDLLFVLESDHPQAMERARGRRR